MVELDPIRGVIYDRNMHPLAVNVVVGSIYASPKEIKDKEKTASILANLLKISEEPLREKFNKDNYFVWIKRKIDHEQALMVSELHLEGIGMIKETRRFYPNKWLASHIVGFVGMDDVGLEGLEVAYDDYLRGVPGWKWTIRDAKARKILSKQFRLIPPNDGYNLVLTIDEVMQHIVEKELENVYKKFKAKSAIAIVMDPNNGDVLALVNRPTFDLNNFGKSDLESRRNRAVTDIFEPGSVFKVVTASAALEKGVVACDDVFYCEDGAFKVKGHVLHDHKPYGDLTFKSIIEESSNIGTVKIAELLGKDETFKFIKSFGFGSKSEIALPGEVKGIVRPTKDWSGLSMAAIPIGQEVAVTSIQLINAISVIANGGVLMKPRIVKEIQDKNGGLVKSFKPVTVKRVISESTASTMKEILEGVVERGTGKKAKLSEYMAGGKTGTAQKIEANGTYSHSNFVASFMGFAPVDNPKIAVIICVDEPRGIYYGGSVAAPAFKKISESILRYLKVQPDRKLIAKR